MATHRSEDAFAELDGVQTPCVRCNVPTTGTLFASANVFTGVDQSGQRIAQWLKPIPVCETHRHDLVRNMSVLSWCAHDQQWGLAGRACRICGTTLTVRYRRT